MNEELKIVLREATTQAPTMIDRLQYATAEQNNEMNFNRTDAFRNKKDNNLLLSRVLSIFQ